MNIVLSHLYSPLSQLLSSQDLIEVNANHSGEVVLETPSKGRFKQDMPTFTGGYWVSLCHVLANLKGLAFDPLTQPALSTQLPGGHRFQALIGPVVETEFCISIRVRRKPHLTLESFGVEGEFKQELLKLVKEGASILVSGGTSSGKTTFLNLLIQEIPEDKRILTVEDTKELIIPHQDHVSYIISRNDKEGAIGYPQVIDHILRSRPDIVLGGEISVPNAYPFMRLLNTGHRGFMTTIHADSPLDALQYTFPQNIQLAELTIPDPLAFLKSKFDLIVQLNKIKSGERRITEAYFPGEERVLKFGEEAKI